MSFEDTESKCVNFFCDSLGGGGAERVIASLANYFISCGLKVNIIMFYKRPIAYEISDKISLYYAQDMPVTTIRGKFIRFLKKIYNRYYDSIVEILKIKDKVPKRDETWFYFWATQAQAYREFLQKNNNSISFGFLVRSNIALSIAITRNCGKTIYCERNNPVRPDLSKNLIKLRDKYCYKFDGAVFQTYDQMAYYKNFRGEKKVILNPLRENLPERFEGIRRKEIVNFCRLSPQKNIPLLIDAFELLLMDYPDYKLRIYGRGGAYDYLVQYINSKNLNENVILEDFAPDIHNRVVDAAMFVSTSDFEGLSNSLLEAMAIGLPCISTDCDGGGAKMVIQNMDNGIIVEKGNKEQVYQAMKKIIEDRDLAEKLSLNAYKLREQLSVDKIAEQWLELLN